MPSVPKKAAAVAGKGVVKSGKKAVPAKKAAKKAAAKPKAKSKSNAPPAKAKSKAAAKPKSKAAAKSKSKASSKAKSKPKSKAAPKAKAAAGAKAVAKAKPKQKMVQVRIAVFDFRATHWHVCRGDKGGKFYVTPNGLYCCCEELAYPDMEYKFRPEPSNAYDSNAVAIFDAEGSMHMSNRLGYVPREWNELVGAALNDKKVTVTGERGDCGQLLSVAVVVEGPEDHVNESYEEYDSEDDEFW
jgi:hypothetical protein